MEITIETAVATDWEVIQKLNNQVFVNDKDHDDDLDLDWPFSPAGLKYYHDLANGEYGKCFLAYSGKIPVGYIALSNKNFGYRKSKYVEVENIGVEPKYRSKGIGEKLIEAARQWAKEQGATKLYVAAFWTNTKAVSFYKKCGFYEMGIELDLKLD